MLLYVLCTLLLGLVTWLIFFRKKRPDFDGPPGLPYLGNVHQMDPAGMHHTLTRWTKEYGAIYKIKIFGKDMVVVNSEDSIRQVLVDKSEVFAGRPYLFRWKYVAEDDIVFQTYSPRWALLKKHCMTGLKLVGKGVARLESIADNMMARMVDKMEEHGGRPFNPRPLLHETVCSINATLIFGWELSEEEEKAMFHYDKRSMDILSSSPANMALDVAPWLRHLPIKAFSEIKMQKRILNDVIGAAARKTVQMTNESAACESALHDIIELSQKSRVDANVTPITLQSIASNLMVGGNVTTSIALTGLLAILASNEALQWRCQEEVGAVLGERSPSLADRAALPYIESVILELMRYLSHAPLIIHMSMEDTDLNGHFIPKGTDVIVNTWGLHHNRALWEEPWSFRPGRFLDENGRLLPPDHPLRKRLFPFGAGRRVCLGEAMARNRLFLFTCTLLQRFTFLPGDESTTHPPEGVTHTPEGASIPPRGSANQSEEAFHQPGGATLAAADPRTWTFGMINAPKDFNIRAIPRK